MKTFIVLLTLFMANLTLALEGHSHHLPSGGRAGLHGMVLYGSNGQYFIDHIPMEHAPHDFQIISEVAILNSKGKVVTLDFSKESFTLKPAAQFSLNDYINGQLSHFSAEIYTGSFEQDGKIITGLENAEVVIKKIIYARQIPQGSTATVITIGSGANTFSVNAITPAKNFQSITSQNTGEVIWCVKGPDFFKPCH